MEPVCIFVSNYVHQHERNSKESQDRLQDFSTCQCQCLVVKCMSWTRRHNTVRPSQPLEVKKILRLQNKCDRQNLSFVRGYFQLWMKPVSQTKRRLRLSLKCFSSFYQKAKPPRKQKSKPAKQMHNNTIKIACCPPKQETAAGRRMRQEKGTKRGSSLDPRPNSWGMGIMVRRSIRKRCGLVCPMG